MNRISKLPRYQRQPRSLPSPQSDLHILIVVWVPMMRNFFRTSELYCGRDMTDPPSQRCRCHSSNESINMNSFLHGRFHMIMSNKGKFAHIRWREGGFERRCDFICGEVDVDVACELHLLLHIHGTVANVEMPIAAIAAARSRHLLQERLRHDSFRCSTFFSAIQFNRKRSFGL